MPDNQCPDIDPRDINSPQGEYSPDHSSGEQNERSHAVLLHPEERLRLLEENVRDFAIVILAADGQIVNWNAGAERMMGWTEAEVVGQPCSLFYTPNDRERDRPAQDLRRAASAGRAVDEQWHSKKDGSQFWAIGVITALRDHDGSLRGFTEILRDTTEQKRAQEEQRQAQEELAATLARLEAAYEQQQRTAEVLQRSILMGPSIYEFTGVEVSTQYEAASDNLLVGGDFFDVFRLANGHVAFVVGDVMGKGLAAAAHTAQIKFALRVILREYPQPAVAPERLNAFLCESEQLDDRGSEGEM